MGNHSEKPQSRKGGSGEMCNKKEKTVGRRKREDFMVDITVTI